MMMKINLNLNATEIGALSNYLAKTLVSVSIEDLRKEPANMLVMSALYELYNKVKGKADNIRLFPTRRTDELYAITVSRTQALALCCVELVPDESNLPVPSEDQTYELNFMMGLMGRFYQTFLI